MSSIVKYGGMYLAVDAVWTGYVILAKKDTGRGVLSNLLLWPGAVVDAVAASSLFGAG